MLDQREDERWTGEQAILLDLPGPPKRRIETQLADISHSGIGVLSPLFMPCGTRVSVLLPPPEESVLHPDTREGTTPEPMWLADGEVVRAVESANPEGRFTLAIRFDRVDADPLDALVERLRQEAMDWASEL